MSYPVLLYSIMQVLAFKSLCQVPIPVVSILPGSGVPKGQRRLLHFFKLHNYLLCYSCNKVFSQPAESLTKAITKPTRLGIKVAPFHSHNESYTQFDHWRYSTRLICPQRCVYTLNVLSISCPYMLFSRYSVGWTQLYKERYQER